jgi:glycosyltransferase involved in cell wall biosynthesis
LRYTIQLFKHFNRAVFSHDSKDAVLLFLSSTPPIQGILGSLVKICSKKSFVYCLQDIFPDSLAGTGLAKKGGLLWKIGRVIENFTYRNADKIIVISEDFKKNIMAKGVPEDKIVVIYNWVDEDAVKEVPRSENTLFDKYNLDRSKFYLTYSGNIGLTQNMDMLLKVMEELKTEAPDIRLVLIGEGAYKEQVVRKIAGQAGNDEKGKGNDEKDAGNDGIIRGSALPNVIMLPFQPYEDISHVFSLGDAGLVISKPGVGANSVPSKTWSIMSASRPVLANFDENELKDIIADHQCGIFTKAGDKDAFKASILELYHHPELCKEYGRNGRQFVMDNLTKEVGTKKYVDVIKSFEKKH